jgi:hypothetical protein
MSRFTLALLLLVLLAAPMPALAISSANFYQGDGEIFDDWNLCRTRAQGSDGFFRITPGSEFEPAILAESLGSNVDSAYRMGRSFADRYADPTQRAEKLFAFVQSAVNYLPDTDQFDMPEFAQNADELATLVEAEDRAYGDCEDYAALLTVMCQGAELRSAIVLAADHAAVLIHLPGYDKANYTLSLKGEEGWVWAEATGKNNPLGWTPERYVGAPLAAYETQDQGLPAVPPTDKPTISVPRHTGTTWTSGISPFFIMLLLVWLFTRLKRR